ncbi:MAG: hypothetical protein QS748_06180 [Candidatus Endonucleobacter bathymodioli]|uniref:Uncharacterized protein n=1 Tax=Candidatus Endonucleibacter bathymodioli TaxID=539814 RepID=A0AA90SD30_9GAMM|nr:hypothetical protein [Candidatus Endonucleobacter bathymodioli]
MAKKKKVGSSLLEREQLNKSESDLRELEGQPQQQREYVLKLFRDNEEEHLLDLFDLSSGSDYNLTHKYLSLLWSYKGVSEVSSIPDEEYQQAISTILCVSQNIMDNWPSLTPKKVSRLGALINDSAILAQNK